MTMVVRPQTFYPVFRMPVKQQVTRTIERRPWISCPRCIGGSMYPENSHEYACIQCGYHSYSKDSKKMDAEVQLASNPVMVTPGDFASQPGSL